MTPADNVIQLNGPKTLTLSPNDVALILDCLADKPFKEVNGLIQSLTQQLLLQNPKRSADEPLVAQEG